MTVVPGKLAIKVNTGILKRDTELFGKMSPFVHITIGSQAKRTGAHRKGGKNPNWNGEILEFDIKNEEEMQLIVYDEEHVKKHDLVGQATYFLRRITLGEEKQKPIEILHKSKMVGTVYLDFDFKKATLSQKVGQNLIKGLNLGNQAQASAVQT